MSQEQLVDKRKLDLGCSFHKMDGYFGMDILKSVGVDVVGDACHMPFKDSSFMEIYSSYALEHIQDQLSVISELWRICNDSAEVKLILPHFSNPAYYDDLTHKFLYSTRTFEHYDHDLHKVTGHPNYLPNVNMKVVRTELRWWPPQVIGRKKLVKRIILNLLNGVINFLANAHPFLCERIWCRWVGGFYEVEFNIVIIKR